MIYEHNYDKRLLKHVRSYYKQRSTVSLPNTKKALEALYESDLFKDKYQIRMAYHILRMMIKRKHTKNCRFIAMGMLTVDYDLIFNHYLNKGYKWIIIDTTITLLALSLKY